MQGVGGGAGGGGEGREGAEKEGGWYDRDCWG